NHRHQPALHRGGDPPRRVRRKSRAVPRDEPCDFSESAQAGDGSTFLVRGCDRGVSLLRKWREFRQGCDCQLAKCSLEAEGGGSPFLLPTVRGISAGPKPG